jgi:phospholipase C
MPAVTTLTAVTYTVTGTGPNGTATSAVTINVDPAYPRLAFSVSPSNIVSGQSTKLFWNTTNVASLTIDNNIGQVANPAGDTVTVTPTQTTTYTATALGTDGATVTSQVTVTLPAAGQVAISLKALTPAVGSGQATQLQWFAANAASVTLDNGVTIPPNSNATGTVTVSPTATTTYTATATDASGNTAKSSATVTVVASGDPNQIKHVILMTQENRTLDNYFGMFDTYRAMEGLNGTFDGLPKDAQGNFTVAIPDHVGNLIKPYHLQTPCNENVPPSWNQSHTDVNGGKMDQFLIKAQSTTNDPNGHRAIGYFDWTDLPFYYEAAAQFGTSDRYFSSLLGPTVPNRMYLFTATSFGHIHSDLWPEGGWTQPTIFQRLREAGISFRYYYQDDSVFLAQFNDWPIDQSFVYPISRYFQDIQNPATLPQVIFIERGEHINNDEHPNNNVQNGAAFVASTITALMASPSWKESAYILNYDEGGGMYDHVPPVPITVPDDIAPIKIKGDAPGGFDVSGFRVPIVVMSPFSKPHFVSHTVRDHTAVLKFIEERFGLAPLTRRDAASPSMWEFFDLSSAPFMTPPTLPAQPASGKACTQADYAKETLGSQ